MNPIYPPISLAPLGGWPEAKAAKKAQRAATTAKKKAPLAHPALQMKADVAQKAHLDAVAARKAKRMALIVAFHRAEKSLASQAKIVAKSVAKSDAVAAKRTRAIVAADADKRISSARLLKLPEDVLFVIKSFFTYQMRTELLEHKYGLAARLNRLSNKNVHQICHTLHLTPEYKSDHPQNPDVALRIARYYLSFPHAFDFTFGTFDQRVPGSHTNRKKDILTLFNEYKTTHPKAAFKIAIAFALLH